jgi:hypothetical protein
VVGTEATSVDAGNDDGCGTAPVATVRTTNLPKVCEAPTKRRRINGDMVSALDRFTESSARIKRMKMEITLQLHVDNKKLEMDILQSQQAIIKCVVALFADVICNVNCNQSNGKGHTKELKLHEDFLHMQ